MKGRSFKFRIWDGSRKQFLAYGCWLNHLDPNEFTCFDRYFKMDEEECILQQSVGIVDKNGKEIYEGDYVNFSCNHSMDFLWIDVTEWRNQEVYYDDKLAGFFFGGQHAALGLDKIMAGSLEVVGNVFENPHLGEG